MGKFSRVFFFAFASFLFHSHCGLASQLENSVVNSSCGAAIATNGADLRPPTTPVDQVIKQCPTPISCSLPELRAAVDNVIPNDKDTTFWRSVRNAPGRILVFAIWLGSVGGTAYLARLAAGWAEEPFPTIATALGAFLGSDLFGRILSPVNDQYGPIMDRIGCTLWNPPGRWGRLMKSSTESERAAAQEVCRLLILIRPYLEEGAKALIQADAELAAQHYLDAVLNAYDLHSWFNLTEASTLRDAHFFIRKVGKISPDIVDKTISLAVEKAKRVHTGEIPTVYLSADLPAQVATTLEQWLKID